MNSPRILDYPMMKIVSTLYVTEIPMPGHTLAFFVALVIQMSWKLL